MRKVKHKTITLRIDPKATKKLYKKLPDVGVKMSLKKATKKEVRILLKHFAKDKWPISYRASLESIFFDAFGLNLDDYLLGALCAANIDFELKSIDGELRFTRAKKRRPKRAPKT